MTNKRKVPPGPFTVKSYAPSGAPPLVEQFETLEVAANRADELDNKEDWAVEGIFDANGNKLWPFQELSIDTVRDLMCHENRALTPEEAAHVLQERFAGYSYEVLLESTRLVEKVKEIVKKRVQ